MTAVAKTKKKTHYRVLHVEREGASVPIAPFFVLGIFLPIDVIHTVPPVVFDAIRYGTALLILVLVHSRPKIAKSHPLLGIVAFLLVLSGGLFVLKGVLFGGSVFKPIISFVSPLIAYLVVRSHIHHRWILLGFVLGCSFSAFDIIMQAYGLPFLGVPTGDGFRFSGFSFSSTAVAPFLAVAICVTVTPWPWGGRHAVLRLISTSVLVIALFLSQGRVGVVGFLAALAVFVGISFLRRPGWVGILTLISGTTMMVSGAAAALADYIRRTDRPSSSDFTSGRNELNSAAWDAFWQGGLLGIHPSEYSLYSPHMAPLSAALNAGLLGLIATSLVCLFLLFYIFFSRRDVPVVFRMIATVALVASFIEPVGFFVGFSRALIIMICFAHFDRAGYRQKIGSSGFRVRADSRGGGNTGG